MKISQMLAAGRPLFSFEFFPPKDDAAAQQLMTKIGHLRELKPDFVSVTYGAGGSTRAKTIDLVSRIKHDVGIESMAHLTCVGHARQEIDGILRELSDAGIDNVLALRGDPPKGSTSFTPHPDGYRYASELAQAVAKMGRFCFGVAGYPEKHVEAPSLEADLAHLKQKVDAGASFVTTQLFFHNGYYFDFVAKARALGVTVPILPGIMPITNFVQIQRFAQMCGARIPDSLVSELSAVQNDLEAVTRIGIRHAAAQCRELLQKGAPGIHFYTLNRSHATREVLASLAPLRQGLNKPLLQDI
jgi:methylenetetrahydrofolate reductase (NADPH)